MRLFDRCLLLFSAIGLIGFAPLGSAAQPSYGPNISLEQAKVVANAAAKEAQLMNLKVAIAIVDTAGHLVYYEKADDTQTASAEVSVAKARSASTFRRTTKVFEDAVANGRTAVLALPGAVPIEGGVPIMVNAKIIGAIGISGASSEEDGVIAAAGISVLK
ncbi:MAG: heme-binding protein [Methylophilaceae bacterium]|nr:heme-binding protein [Methylophilaceae bacterium]